MLYRHPVIGGELLDHPITAEAANAAVLLSTKGIVWIVVNTAAVDMRHPGLDAQGKPQATSLVGGEDGTREPVGRVIREPQRLRIRAHFDDGRDWPKGFVFRDGHVVGEVGEHLRGSTNPRGSPPNTCRAPACRLCFINSTMFRS